MSLIYSLVFLHFCTFALCLSNFVFISPIHCSFILPHPEFRSASFSLSVLFIYLSLLLALFHAQFILTARYCVCLLLNVFTLDFVAFVACCLLLFCASLLYCKYSLLQDAFLFVSLCSYDTLFPTQKIIVIYYPTLNMFLLHVFNLSYAKPVLSFYICLTSVSKVGSYITFIF